MHRKPAAECCLPHLLRLSAKIQYIHAQLPVKCPFLSWEKEHYHSGITHFITEDDVYRGFIYLKCEKCDIQHPRKSRQAMGTRKNLEDMCHF